MKYLLLCLRRFAAWWQLFFLSTAKPSPLRNTIWMFASSRSSSAFRCGASSPCAMILRLHKKTLCCNSPLLLTWRSIQADGKPLQFVSQPYESDIDHSGELSEAVVTLPKEIPPGELLNSQSVMKARLRWMRAADSHRHAEGKRDSQRLGSDQPLSFSAVRGVGNVVWYPIAMEAANLSTKGQPV